MKKSALIGLVIFVHLVLSCATENENMYPREGKAKELVEIGFDIAGEFSVSKTPLKNSETVSSDLFGIQVYDIENDKPYAHVVGDNIDLIKINLIKDQNFMIKMTYLKNGKNIIRRISEDAWTPPFDTGSSETALNKVYYSSASELYLLSSSYIDTEIPELKDKMGRYIEIDRYHGEVPGFVSSEDSITLNLDLKRMAFGINMDVELQDPEVEELQFSINSHYHEQVFNIAMTEGKGTLEIPYLSLGFPNIYSNEMDFGIDDNYQENVHISIGTPENGLLYFDGKILVPRNVRMMIHFTPGPAGEGISNTLVLELEEGDMEEEEVSLPTDN